MSAARQGVNLVGFLTAEFGQGEVARRLDAALRHAGIPHRTIPYEEVPHRQEHPFEHASSDDDYDVNVLCLNAEHLLGFATRGSDLLVDHYSVGVWFWETSRFPVYLKPALKFVDELWVASNFVASAIGAETSIPVVTFPLPVEVPKQTSVTRAELGLPDDRFVFVFVFDFYSTVERKNPDGLIEAFKRAFEPDDGAFLLVKSINGGEFPDDLRRLEQAAEGRPDIRVVDGFAPAEHIRAYAALTDAAVSLHRSEGFGLTVAEAMAHGKPVIATGYSGNLAFMNEGNSYLVPYSLTELEDDVGSYPAGSIWAEPDLDEAARLMRRVVENPEEARERGERGRKTIEEEHSLEATARFLTGRMPSVAALSTKQKEVKTPTGYAADYLARGPQLSWTARTRLGRPGVWMRKVLLRVLRPYLARHSEFEHAVVDALRELELWRAQEQMRGARLDVGTKMLRERIRELTKRVEELERELRRQRGGR
jgi:glycosyltransferase involved in cell wall biosynthesis